MTGTKVQQVEIDEHQAGQRIDNYLLSCFPKVPKSRIYRALRSGEVRVNRKRIKPVYRLQTGDRVRIPPIRVPQQNPPANIPLHVCAEIERGIIYEDEQILAINKPSGIAVHSGSGEQHGVIEILRRSRTHQPFLELAHRIDKETSGCLVLAKTRRSLLEIQQSLRNRTSVKRYLCLVKGRWDVRDCLVTHSLQRNRSSEGTKMSAHGTGMTAKTRFSTREIFPLGTLMEAQIYSGRTHQIRVHAQAEQHPIGGDRRYGDFQYNRALQKLGLRRMFLHASYLQLRLGEQMHNIELSAPLPDELKQLCERLKLSKTRC